MRIGLGIGIGMLRGAPWVPDAPVVTAPTTGADVYEGVAVTVSATVTAGQVPVRIDFVLDPGGGETVIATDSASPFSQSWVPTAGQVGSHTLVARFVFAGGHVDSSPINVRVYDPSLITTAMWVRGKSIGVSDGAAMTTWSDESGNARNMASQFGGDPTFRATGGPNALPCVEFDGINDNLKAAFTLNRPAHLFFVGKFKTTPSAGDTLCDGATVNSIRVYASSATDLSLYGGAGITDAGVIDTNWHIFEAYADNGTGSVLKQGDDAGATGNAGANNPGGLVFGIAGDIGTGPTDCYVAEGVMCATQQTGAARTAIINYLKAKYSL